jgi:tetratricopeptide (TPR) repeat protein
MGRIFNFDQPDAHTSWNLLKRVPHCASPPRLPIFAPVASEPHEGHPSSARPKAQPAAAPAPRRERPRRRRLWRVGCLVGLGLVIAAVLVSKPVTASLQRWQARNIVSQAEELARQQMFYEAIERLDTALRLNPSSEDGLRALAAIYTRFELPYALPVWRALLQMPGHNDRDLHQYIDLSLKLQRFDLAEPTLAQLLARTNVTEASRVQAMEFFMRQGDFARALEFAQQLRRAAPSNTLHQIRTVRLLLLLPNEAHRREGFEILRGLEHPSPEERRGVLEILSEAVDAPPGAVQEVLDHLALPQEAPPSEHFLRAEIMARLSPVAAASWITNTVARFRNDTPERQAELGAWLNRIGESELLLKTYQLAEISRYPPILATYLEALARTGKWGDLQAAAASPLPLDDWLLDSLRSFAAARLGQDTMAKEHWRRALGNASSDPGRLRSLGDLAAKLGATDQAIEAFNRLTRDRLSRVTGYRRLAQVYERSRDTQRLRAVMREWSAHVPDDPVPDNAFCYLSGLMRRDVEVAHERARRLLDRLPGRIAHRTTVALLELQRDHPDVALQLFERIRAEIPRAALQTRVVYAAALAANGKSDLARELLEGVKVDALLPEEQQLVGRIRRGG